MSASGAVTAQSGFVSYWVRAFTEGRRVPALLDGAGTAPIRAVFLDCDGAQPAGPTRIGTPADGSGAGI